MSRWSRSAKVFAIGHSTRPLDELVKLLSAHGVRTVADVRTVPRSRTTPQFNAKRLARALPAEGIAYAPLPRLGGLRHSRRGTSSPNQGWRNASFRSYADYMLTTDFRHGLEELHALARRGPVAILCAEALPWRCHRSLIADALAARGVTVRNIETARRARPHVLTPFAHVDRTRVTYPPAKAA
jgi:uncharacterized protein (DUF488 family)